MSTVVRALLPPSRPRGPWVALQLLPIVALTIPASVVLAGPLKSNGWPARLMVFWIAAAVALGWVQQKRPRRSSPVEYGCWLLLLGLACSLAASWLRALDPVEAAGAIRYALVMFPLPVVALGIAATATPRLCDRLLLALLIGAALSSFVAVAQFVVPFEWSDLFQIPGLDAHGTAQMMRDEFLRVRGASDHPIEFGVLAGAVTPIGLHFARFGPTRLGRQLAAIGTFVCIAAIPMSVSRSGILVLLLALATYAVVLTGQQRLVALVLGLAGLVMFRATVPGLLGTVLGAFRNSSEDTSIASRTRAYAAVYDLVESSPVLGYGLGTFRPELYIYLDNQYLMSLVEGGIVLVGCVIVWLLLGLASARGAARRARDAVAASRAQAVLGATLAIGVSGAFFDLFSFGQATIMLFVLVGVAGALWHDGVLHGRPLPSPLERTGLRRTGTADPAPPAPPSAPVGALAASPGGVP
ncbi:O-antigen ligase family protein [Georgenia thermotolerans]|uniref:O-antigen ligase-related domain-containing protein n=1 Tax=Georgenia thermotolerans TaxID=527326 RepID=A0A7J5UR23_9MICO|nr:O-antigen ligase family protein [Georgenia thermotolerans]KAE8764892.1 hypothetical protein GB883_06705 [Georgenia thermotolerans]